MSHALRSVDGHRKYLTLTDLNRDTSARFAACAGQHVASGQTIRRWFPGVDRELPVCARCGVPFGGPKTNWSSGPARGPKMPE